MVAHVAVGEQLVADEQMAQIDAPAVLGQRRAGDRHLGSKASSSASLTGPMLPSAVESKVEQYLNRICPAPWPRAATRAPPATAGSHPRRRDRARLERDDRLGIAWIDVARRHADQLGRRHAVPDQHAREVGGTGEVVGDAAKRSGTGGSDMGVPLLYGRGPSSAVAPVCAKPKSAGRRRRYRRRPACAS